MALRCAEQDQAIADATPQAAGDAMLARDAFQDRTGAEEAGLGIQSSDRQIYRACAKGVGLIMRLELDEFLGGQRLEDVEARARADPDAARSPRHDRRGGRPFLRERAAGLFYFAFKQMERATKNSHCRCYGLLRC